ncbi:MAG: hypothetical protein ACC651_02010 [Candidatus Scalindua sp.]
MLKNITLSADESIIKRARNRAAGEHTTLNAKFRYWLKRYAMKDRASGDYIELMKKMEYAKTDRKFTRDEMNER